MSINQEILDLIDLSKTIGEMPDLIQGGGGNISAKIDNNIMAIKASGMCLKDLDFNNGISFVQHKNILSYITVFNDKSELSVDDYIKGQVLTYKNWEMKRPSIETGFHVVLKKYTIHSHSVYANILCCSKEGKELAARFYPDAIWIDYLPPGEALTFEIFKNRNKALYFIQNHGVITTAETKEQALKLHLQINEQIKSAFIIDDYEIVNGFKPDVDYMRKHVLFPDQVVYTINDDVIKSNAAVETIKSYFYILNMIIKNKLSPNFLSKEDIEIIDNMESEKYRKGLIKQ